MLARLPLIQFLLVLAFEAPDSGSPSFSFVLVRTPSFLCKRGVQKVWSASVIRGGTVAGNPSPGWAFLKELSLVVLFGLVRLLPKRNFPVAHSICTYASLLASLGMPPCLRVSVSTYVVHACNCVCMYVYVGSVCVSPCAMSMYACLCVSA